MAQINARVADEDKEKAEQILKAHGLSVSGYFASVIEYIADTGAVPFEIKQKPKLVNFDEVYAEAVEKFSDLYNGLVSLKNLMQPGVSDQLERCRSLCNDHSLAISFLQENERYVYGAPCQMEKVSIGNGSLLDFSLGRERFPAVKTGIAHALSCVNFNTRDLERSDLEEMSGALSEAGKVLQSLRDLSPGERSTESRIAFFVTAALDAIQAARVLTEGPYEPFMFHHWFTRLDAVCRDVVACRKRVGATKWDAQIQMVADCVATVKNEIDVWNGKRLDFASQNNSNWLSFHGNAIELADEQVRKLQRAALRGGSR
ncbi:type II toxin-antitoxin system RelB/DinJ family antitoxin [Pseudomonas putida]|uniref:type II toxin-antitoxin system RelB/DinJ family antitoxin n=1 Tax=Pseudomonas putida TaxID=303 RepID=UPI002363A5B8|nr:type II toxin-antitoxin system RelB/DinJ family antitoxin [Pseudomonas putida]MDD2068589.1 type II toxin-antitoxin system RelB/DinJ family antitoxin [Pseudomonas putida]HDS1738524.1 type II toxin-antitoxin system RelB/DinJ family antitoxin [Pseudomonas putida]